MNLVGIFLAAMLVDNVVLMRFLALCSFFGLSGKPTQSLRMGTALSFVAIVATCVTWPLYHWVLLPLGLDFLKIVVFILVIAALVQSLDIYLKKKLPRLREAFGAYLPLLTANCAIFAVTLDNVSKNYGFLESLVYSIGAAAGYMVSILLLSAVRERIKTSPVPAFLKGAPILFVATSLLALSFMGFQGLIRN